MHRIIFLSTENFFERVKSILKSFIIFLILDINLFGTIFYNNICSQ